MQKLKRDRMNSAWAVVALAAIVGLIIVGAISEALSGEEEVPRPTPTAMAVPTLTMRPMQMAPPTPAGTPRPTSTPFPAVTPGELHAERDANASRFDAKYKGRWVKITGTVVKIDGGYLHLGHLENQFQDRVALAGLSQQVLIDSDKGDKITAVCKVGDYLIIMYLNSCWIKSR